MYEAKQPINQQTNSIHNLNTGISKFCFDRYTSMLLT